MNRLRQWLSDILAAPGLLRDIDRKLDRLLRQQVIVMARIDNLEAEVAANTEVDGSAIVLLTGLTQMIADLKAAGTDPATAARIDAMVARLNSDRQRLTDAITANTPSA